MLKMKEIGLDLRKRIDDAHTLEGSRTGKKYLKEIQSRIWENKKSRKRKVSDFGKQIRHF